MSTNIEDESNPFITGGSVATSNTVNIEDWVKSDVEMSSLSDSESLTVQQNDNVTKVDDTINDNVEDTSVTDQKVEDIQPKRMSLVGKSESVKQSSSPRVKLTRKSPYVIGPPTAILKGTPKPVITRKPALPKDKPKVPVKPNKLILRSASSSPATRAQPAVAGGNGDTSLSSLDLSPDFSSLDSTADEILDSNGGKYYRFNDNKSGSSPNLTVLSQGLSERKAAATKPTPISPENGPSATTKKRATSLVRKSPVARPRTSSFRRHSEYINLSVAPGSENILSVDSNANNENSSNEEPKRKELRPNNSLIITVFGSNNNNATPLRNKNQEAANDTPNNDKESDSNAPSNETSAETPKVQRSLAVKNREALEAIRQSLSNKLISQAPPARVIESMKASGSPVIDMITDNSSNNATPTKPKIEKKISSSFEDARAALEGTLHFSRHAMPSNSPPVSTGSNITVSTPSSAKRQAPKPPSNTTQETSEIIIDNDSKKVAAAKIDDSVDSSVGERQRLSAPEIEVSGANTNDERVVVDESKNIEGKEEIEQTTNYADEHLQNSPSISIQQNSPSTPIETPKLTPAIRHSSMKSDLKPRDNKAPRSVQFSPDTMTVTVPANEPRPPKMISYNRWIAKNPYLESSFTGQPISMLPPGAVPPAVAKQQKMVPYPTAPVVDDTPRKWTEKKKKWRSKSTPRVSEIDELMGSSKTKAPSKLAIFTSPSSPEPPIRRQSRVEIYESEKQKVSTKKGKFSLKNLFFPPGANGVGNNGSNGDGNAPNNSAQGGGVNSQGQYNNENKFLDKEHEREILERHKVKTRPEIIHPLDLINGGVEVVKITPKNSLKGHYDRQKLSLPGSTTSQRRATIMSRSSEHINSLRSSAAYEMTAVSDYLNGHGTPLHMRSTPEIVTKIDVEGKDSGHDTSSIHTESSEDTATGSADYSNGSSSTEHTLSPIGMVAQPNVEALNNQISILGLNSSGKPKPPPPPRSKSLEVLEKSDSGDLEYPASGHPFQVTLDTGSLDNLLDSSCDTTPRIHTIHHSEEGLVTPRYTTSDTYSDNTSVRTTNTTRSNGLREVPLAPPPPPSVTQSLNNHFMLTGKNPSNVEDAAASPFSNVSHSSSIAQFINKTLATNAAFANATSTAVSIPTSVAAIDAANNAALIAAAAAAAANSAAAAANFHHQKSNSTSGSLSSEPMSECSSSLVRYPVNGASNGGNGSEADSERDSVSPQRGVCEEKLQDNDSPVVASNRRRLSVRRGRSIVHKNLEDNYGAVISANHEALAQILEQVSENRPVPASLRPLTTATAATSPQFADFSVLSESEGVRTPRRAFFPATWGPAHLPVTLMVSRDMSLTGSQATSAFSLNPVTQFVDQIPNYLLSTSSQGSGLGTTQGVVWALPRTNIISLPTAAKQLHQRKKGMRQEEFEKELNFVLLQVMNGLKYLQAQGVEMVNTSLDRILLARTDTDHNYRLIITDEVYQPIGGSTADTALTNSQQQLSLCECGLAAMLLMFQLTTATPQMLRDKAPLNLAPVLPSVSMYKTMATILQKDGSVALGQVKCMLEYMLWGPSDIIFEVRADHEVESREEWLQRWLDLERANVLNNIIRSQGLWNIQLNVFQEYHLLFLVRTCAKMLRESSLLFESEVSRM